MMLTRRIADPYTPGPTGSFEATGVKDEARSPSARLFARLAAGRLNWQRRRVERSAPAYAAGLFYSSVRGQKSAFPGGAPIHGNEGSFPAGVCTKPTPNSGTVARRVARDITCDKAVRSDLRQLLSRFAVPTTVSFDVVLAAGEAVTNAIRYGEGDHLTWSARVSPEEVVIELWYSTAPFKSTPCDDHGDLARECGRGIMMIHRLMDRTDFHFARGQVHISLFKAIG